MTSRSMHPEEAQAALWSLAESAIPPPGNPTHGLHFAAAHALETVANMQVEEQYSVVPHEQVEGRYETRLYTRLTTDWQPQ